MVCGKCQISGFSLFSTFKVCPGPEVFAFGQKNLGFTNCEFRYPANLRSDQF